MATNVLSQLHSHSGLERNIRLSKRFVLVDEKFKNMFLSDTIKPYKYKGTTYYQVPVISFVKAGGIFKNLSS